MVSAGKFSKSRSGIEPFDITEAVALSARTLRDCAEQNHDFGYELAILVARVMLVATLKFVESDKVGHMLNR
jgi:hypothetical protein